MTTLPRAPRAPFLSSLLGAALAGLLFCSPAGAATLVDLRLGEHPHFVRLVLELDEAVEVELAVKDNKLLVLLPAATQAGAQRQATATALAARFLPASGENPPRVEVAAGQRMTLARRFTLPGRHGQGRRWVFDFVAAAVPAPSLPRETPPPGMTESAAAPLAQGPHEAPPEDFSSAIPFDLTGAGITSRRFSVSGYIEAEGRWFPQDSRDGAASHMNGSFAAQPSLAWSWADGDQQLVVTGFGRLDGRDRRRSHGDIREAKWIGVFGPLELRLGFDTVFWGVTEAVHLVDIINQDDALEDIDQEDKLGQLMASAKYVSELGTFAFYALPWTRERRFPGAKGRPNLPLPVDRSQTQWQAGDKDWRFSWAARWSHAMGPFDLGLSYFAGNARDPRLLPGLDGDGAPVLVPRYDLIKQAGIDAQATLGAWLLKFEGLRQWTAAGDFTALAAGFEYTLFNLSDGAADLGLLAEYLYDSRGKTLLSPFENDVFLGLRLAATDAANTAVLAGVIIDAGGKANALNIEAGRRLGEKWYVSLDARLFFDVAPPDGLLPLADDDFLQLRFTRYF